MGKARKSFSYAAVLILAAVATACSPTPRRTLTQEEKIADLQWLFAQFNQNYAPLEYKEARYGIRFDELKSRYLRDSEATRTNEEFYLLMHRYVAEFRDAHTASSLTTASLPSRTLVAYLGFDGTRDGATFRVTKFLPTINTKIFPLRADDLIVALDGVALPEAVKATLLPYRNLGHDEANLTYHMPKLFNRTSLDHPIPTGETAVLKVLRDKKEIEIRLPWIVKDLYAFTEEQAKAAAASPSPSPTPGEDKSKERKMPGAEDSPGAIAGVAEDLFFRLGLQGLSGEIDLTPGFLRMLMNARPGKRFWNSFIFIDTSPTWLSRIVTGSIAAAAGQAATPIEELKLKRTLPAGALFVTGSNTYPTYVSAEKLETPEGPKTRYVATMYLPTFSPEPTEDLVLTEVKDTLRYLKEFGVTDLVIDLIDNGGGSLRLGMQMAQLLSQERLIMPELQLKVSETWLDEFETVSLAGGSDPERAIGRRVFTRLQDDLARGRKLSDPMNAEDLFPFQIQADPTIGASFRVALLVNEMCASMCDIFTAILKDNGKAIVVGSRTMGAGGNVVTHFQAPNSHLIVNQTESLIRRKDGSYIENNGVEPDFAMAVHETVAQKYAPVRAKAIELLLTTK